jgi:hypothetical protein
MLILICFFHILTIDGGYCVYENNFFVPLVTSLYFWTRCYLLRLLIPINPMFWKNILDPYLVHDPERHDLYRKIDWSTFFCYFLHFRKVNNTYPGDFFFQNVKNVKFRPTLRSSTVQIMFCTGIYYIMNMKCTP